MYSSPLITRINLYQKLLDIFEGETARWVQYKIAARPEDDAKQSEIDAYDSEQTNTIYKEPRLILPRTIADIWASYRREA